MACIPTSPSHGNIIPIQVIKVLSLDNQATLGSNPNQNFFSSERHSAI